MIIWLNGAFGAGKTTVARELSQHLPGSILFDPELIGFRVRRSLRSSEGPSDFQDIPEWRDLTIDALAVEARRSRYPVIVPMTLVRQEYFDQIMTGIRQVTDVRHFTLVASASTLRVRLLRRWSSPQSKAWTLRQIDRCVTALADPYFSIHVQTDDRTVKHITEEIAATLIL